MPDLQDADIWKMNGPVKLIPNNGYTCNTFRFVNVTDDNICDLRIVSKDLDFGIPSPEILVDHTPAQVGDGVRIQRVEYEKDAQGNPVKSENGRPKKTESPIGFTRTNRDAEKKETEITFNDCIAPGGFFNVILCLDAPLTSNRQISFSPSHEDGSGFTGVSEKPDPLTLTDLLKIIAGLGGTSVGTLLGKATEKTVGDIGSELIKEVTKDSLREVLKELRDRPPSPDD